MLSKIWCKSDDIDIDVQISGRLKPRTWCWQVGWSSETHPLLVCRWPHRLSSSPTIQADGSNRLSVYGGLYKEEAFWKEQHKKFQCVPQNSLQLYQEVNCFVMGTAGGINLLYLLFDRWLSSYDPLEGKADLFHLLKALEQPSTRSVIWRI